MQRSVRRRGLGHGVTGHGVLGRGGACLAFASSILALAALPSPAMAGGDDRHHNHGVDHYSVRLTPEEVRDGGDRGGSGMARLELDEARQTACYVFEWDRLEGDVTAAHLHAAPRAQDGPHAIDFFNDAHIPGDHNMTAGCVTSTREQIREIIEHPDGYYIMIHTTAFQPGAIRGQLG